MRKIILMVAMALGFAVAINAQDFRLGGRVGSGFQAQAEYCYNGANYLEGRLGMGWYHGGLTDGLTADFTVLHNWNICTMDWTPSAGQWFFDAGAGLTVGGAANFVNIGVAGCAKMGLEFNDVPIRLALDWTPAFGPAIGYYGKYSGAEFNAYGLANLGISAVYRF